MEYPEPTLFAIPFFLIALLVEYRLVQKRVLRGEHLAGYEARDSRASLWMGVGSIVWVGAINLGVFRLATWLYAHRVCTIESSMLVWALGLVGWDFSFYVHHRLEHEVRILWACHVSHHSSVRYNLSTALRQPWTPWPMLVLFPPWALLGVPPKAIMISGGINLIYQYWVHTETIGKLPRWFEAVFNTPSHHRVHHASNPAYLDKNYGGILIVWDKLFGTFAPEVEPVRYGLTKNIESHRVWFIAFHEYASVIRDLRGARTWRERVGIVLRSPSANQQRAHRE